MDKIFRFWRIKPFHAPILLKWRKKAWLNDFIAYFHRIGVTFEKFQLRSKNL
jgi:hypothetical protein